jgi:thioredoxin reductase (NADPH)
VEDHEVIIIGGGLAGLSAAVYLGRAMRDALVLDDRKSLARWEPDVQNYLGFPDGIDGNELLSRARAQAERFGSAILEETISKITRRGDLFELTGAKGVYTAGRLLIATGIYHLPPKIAAVDECLGHSMFFCKDCDGFKVRDKRVAIIGANNDAVEYALGILLYTATVCVLTNGTAPGWDKRHDSWVQEHEIPVHKEKITDVHHTNGYLESLSFADGLEVAADFLFTTRGDVFHNELATQLGAELDQEGQIKVDSCQRTTVPRVFAAGCVTPANCQMIIAAGEGARAAQAINREMFEESLANHTLRRRRDHQLRHERTQPEVLSNGSA